MNCVYHASTVDEADIIVAWLADRGISAFVKDRHMAGNFVTMAVAPKGVEVCVADSEQSNLADQLLKEHDQERNLRPLGDFEKILPMPCGGCGMMLEFPGELHGTVQSCPMCGQRVDVGQSSRFC
jgi:hypothetical protein